MILRRPLEGSYPVDGILFESRGAFVRSMLPMIALGDRIFRLGDALVVLLGIPRRLRSTTAGGLLLVRRGPHLVGYEGEADDELPDEPSLALLERGRVRIVPFATLVPVDLAELVEAPGIEVHEVDSLGLPPRPPALPTATPTSEAESVRSLFGVAASDAQKGFVRAIAARSVPSRAQGIARWILTILGALALSIPRLLLRFLPSSSAVAGRSRTNEQGRSESDVARRAPSWFDALRARLDRFVALYARLRGEQARYLSRLLDAIDEGSVEEILRSGIPLGGGEGAGLTSLATPTPRAEIAIRPRMAESGSSLRTGEDFLALLRAGYERTFTKLDRLGRVDEAAFVLAELLRDDARAVDYLERHDRFRLAAELADARKLPPERAVALWFLAGDVARAITAARRTGTFPSAIDRLAQSGRREAADALRIEYAELLARSGNRIWAVDVVWPVVDARERARDWLEEAMAGPPATAGRGYARFVARFVRDDESAAAIHDAVSARLEATTADAAVFREAYTRQTVGHGSISTYGGHLLGRAFRGLLRDRHDHGVDDDHLLRAIRAALPDRTLLADLPPVSAVDDAPASPRVLSPLDRGAHPILDAVLLPDGRALVALGELGTRVVRRDGTIQRTFASPAEFVVLDERGERAIVGMRRTDGIRFARIDLVTNRIAPWFTLACDVVAPNFDGSTLLVGRDAGRELLVLDAIDDEVTVLHALPGLSAPVVDFAIESNTYRARLRPDDGPSEILELDRRTFRLLSALPLGCADLSGFGQAWPRFRDADDDRAFAIGLVTSGSPDVVGVRDGEGIRIMVGDERAGTSTLVARLDGSTRVRARRSGNRLLVSDDLGRLVVIDGRRRCVLSASTLAER